MFNEIYRGLVIREESCIFQPRLVVVALTETSDANLLAKEGIVFLNNIEESHYFVGLINNPHLGLLICLNLKAPGMDDKSFIKEVFRCAFFKALTIFSCRLALETSNPREKQWLEHKYLKILDEVWDELDFALSK